MIAISEKTKKYLDSIAEGSASICIETGICRNDCFWVFDCEEDLLEFYGYTIKNLSGDITPTIELKEFGSPEFVDDYIIKSNNDVIIQIPISDIDPSEFDIKDIDKLLEYIDTAEKMLCTVSYDDVFYSIIS